MSRKKILPYEKLKTLEKTFKNIEDDKSKLALSLLDEAYFCGETLKRLKDKINREGVVTSMCQGSYDIDRENPALRSYNTTIKNYQNLIKQITELLPEKKEKNEDDEFEQFCDSL